MSDTLTIFGNEFNNVTSIIADNALGKNKCTLTTAGNSYAYLQYNNVYYYHINDSFTFTPGDVLRCLCQNGGTNVIYIDGEVVAGGETSYGPASYNYTLPNKTIEAKFQLSPGTSRIYITTQDNELTYVRPQGTKTIEENGENIDVNNYATIDVDVKGSVGSIWQDDSNYVHLSSTGLLGAVVPLITEQNGIYSPISSQAFNVVDVNIDLGEYVADDIALRSISSNIYGKAERIGDYAFPYCSSLTTVSFLNCKSIGLSAFAWCSALTTISFPSCTNIGANAFAYCYSLTTVSFPNCTNISANAFQYCSLLTTISFPNCTSISNFAFYTCTSLTTASFPSCTSIGSYAFYCCYNLLSLYLLGSSVCSLANINAFQSTPISTYTTSTGGVNGSIYVPSSLYSTYIASTNWVAYAARFVSV